MDHFTECEDKGDLWKEGSCGPCAALHIYGSPQQEVLQGQGHTAPERTTALSSHPTLCLQLCFFCLYFSGALSECFFLSTGQDNISNSLLDTTNRPMLSYIERYLPYLFGKAGGLPALDALPFFCRVSPSSHDILSSSHEPHSP